MKISKVTNVERALCIFLHLQRNIIGKLTGDMEYDKLYENFLLTVELPV